MRYMHACFKLHSLTVSRSRFIVPVLIYLRAEDRTKCGGTERSTSETATALHKILQDSSDPGTSGKAQINIEITGEENWRKIGQQGT